MGRPGDALETQGRFMESMRKVCFVTEKGSEYFLDMEKRIAGRMEDLEPL